MMLLATDVDGDDDVDICLKERVAAVDELNTIKHFFLFFFNFCFIKTCLTLCHLFMLFYSFRALVVYVLECLKVSLNVYCWYVKRISFLSPFVIL